jgi:hypothetical protein
LKKAAIKVTLVGVQRFTGPDRRNEPDAAAKQNGNKPQ